jgi:hypothetical protein
LQATCVALRYLFRNIVSYSSCLLLISSVSAWSVEAPENQIKAAYLYNFCKFTDWPSIGKTETAHEVTPVPLYVCLLGDDPFMGDFDKLAEGKSIKNRPLKVRHPATLRELDPCDVLYLSKASEKNMIVEALRIALQKHALSVGDSSDFIDLGGQIRLLDDRGRIAFEVNLAALNREGLRVDARVLSLAKKVWR